MSAERTPGNAPAQAQDLPRRASDPASAAGAVPNAASGDAPNGSIPGHAVGSVPHHAKLIRRLSQAVIVLAIGEYLIATVGVQINILPRRTDFASYYFAGILTKRGALPYDQPLLAAEGYRIGFEHEQFPFLYPPPFALAMQPLANLDYESARQVWMLLSTVALLGALWLLARLLRLQAAQLGIQSPHWYWVLLAAFFPSVLNSTGLHNDVRQGSVGAMLLLVFVFLIWSCMKRRDASTGLALALATVLKLAPLAMLPYIAWRRSRRAAGWTLALLALSMVPAIIHWGPSIVHDYVELALLPGIAEERPWPHNQSIDSYLSSIFVRTPPIQAPLHIPWLKQVLSILVSLAVVGVTAWRVRPRRIQDGLLPVESGLVVVALLLVMKITWVHTLTAMLFVWPTLMMPIYRAAEQGTRAAVPVGVLACIGFLLSSAHLPILWNGLNTWPLLLVPGIHMWGLILIWGVAGFVLGHAPEFLGSRRPSC